MAELSAAATLDLWEAAERLDRVERAVALAAFVEPKRARDDVARLPLGRRDARLLELHAALAGSSLEATAPCPECREQAELEVDVGPLLERARAVREPAPVESDGLVVTWRPPDSLDVAAAAVPADAAAAERVLLERCVGVDVLSGTVRERVVEAMAEADPLAEVLFDVACPACGASFVVDVDVAALVWASVESRARRLLREVDVLARAYGWSEREVVALGERRRNAYVALAAEG